MWGIKLKYFQTPRPRKNYFSCILLSKATRRCAPAKLGSNPRKRMTKGQESVNPPKTEAKEVPAESFSGSLQIN